MQPSLQTTRLLLRPYEQSDAADVRRLAGDARIADTTLVIPHPYPEGAAEAWIAEHPRAYADRSEITFAITLRDSGALAGTASLLGFSQQHARAELGYWVGVAYWNQGIGTEAVERLIRFAHEDLGVTRVMARCLACNPASARVMEKAGMQAEGRLAAHVLKNGRYEDMLLYGLLLPGRGSEADPALD
ncbi:MAG TPA: GNAT family N-acetyltransferase [Burkholderiales bacterium]|nr:GNAT family N-acetyltransferase [Burkholderiales bacterium]